MTDPTELFKEADELLTQAVQGNYDPMFSVRVNSWKEAVAALEPCLWCDGKGFEMIFETRPETCGNCAYGDCDYGHERKETCTSCQGTGKKAARV